MKNNLSHNEAIKSLCDCAATVTVLSYQEVIEGYFKLRGLPVPSDAPVENAKPALSANDRHLVALLRREGRHSGVWFGDQLLKAAALIEHLAASVENAEPVAINPFSPERIAWSAAETKRLQRELDITNADHVALWLEANTIPDEPMSQCISWLACRIVEGYECAVSYSGPAPIDLTARLREARREAEIEKLLVLIETAHEHGDECAIVEQAAAIRALSEGTEHDPE